MGWQWCHGVLLFGLTEVMGAEAPVGLTAGGFDAEHSGSLGELVVEIFTHSANERFFIEHSAIAFCICAFEQSTLKHFGFAVDCNFFHGIFNLVSLLSQRGNLRQQSAEFVSGRRDGGDSCHFVLLNLQHRSEKNFNNKLKCK